MQIIMFATRARASMLYTAVVFPTIFCSLVIFAPLHNLHDFIGESSDASARGACYGRAWPPAPPRSVRSISTICASISLAGAPSRSGFEMMFGSTCGGHHAAYTGDHPGFPIRTHHTTGTPGSGGPLWGVGRGSFRMFQDVAGSAVTSNGNASQPFLPTHLPEQLPDLCGARAGGGLQRGRRRRREVRSEGVEGELRVLGEGDKLGPDFKNLIGTFSQPAGPTCEFLSRHPWEI